MPGLVAINLDGSCEPFGHSDFSLEGIHIDHPSVKNLDHMVCQPVVIPCHIIGNYSSHDNIWFPEVLTAIQSFFIVDFAVLLEAAGGWDVDRLAWLFRSGRDLAVWTDAVVLAPDAVG